MQPTPEPRPAPYSALRDLVNLWDLAPVCARNDDGVVKVDVSNLAALEIFAAALGKELEHDGRETFSVAHEVDGVPAIFTATARQVEEKSPCRLQILTSGVAARVYFWRFVSGDGEQVLARSESHYLDRRSLEEAAVAVFGLDSTEQLRPGATWLGHGHELVVVEEVGR